MTAETWEQLLAELEARLDAAERLAAGETSEPVPEFVEPTVIEPMPVHLRVRAQAAAERSDALRARLEAETARIRADLRRLPSHRPGERAPAFFELGA